MQLTHIRYAIFALPKMGTFMIQDAEH